MSKDRDPEPRLRQKNGERMGRKRQNGEKVAVVPKDSGEHSQLPYPPIDKARHVGRREPRRETRLDVARPWKGIGGDFTVSSKCFVFHESKMSKQTSRMSSVLPITPEGPNDSARARWSATRRKWALRRYQLRGEKQPHGQ